MDRNSRDCRGRGERISLALGLLTLKVEGHNLALATMALTAIVQVVKLRQCPARLLKRWRGRATSRQEGLQISLRTSPGRHRRRSLCGREAA